MTGVDALADRLPADAAIGVSRQAIKEFAPSDRLYSRLDYFDDDAAIPTDHYFVCVRRWVACRRPPECGASRDHAAVSLVGVEPRPVEWPAAVSR